MKKTTIAVLAIAMVASMATARQDIPSKQYPYRDVSHWMGNGPQLDKGDQRRVCDPDCRAVDRPVQPILTQLINWFMK